MSNRRVKNLAYDDDDLGYDEDQYEAVDDGLTDDDKAQLRLGTIKVHELLGIDFPISEEEIQEALWHYYYDVEKSVTYLKSGYSSIWQCRDADDDQTNTPQNQLTLQKARRQVSISISFRLLKFNEKSTDAGNVCIVL